MTDRAQIPVIADFIALLAERADAFASMAGVGSMETAGHLISYLHENPRDLEPWLNGGFMELPDNWIERGSLTYHALNGKIMSPRTARQKRVIKALKDVHP